MSAAHLRTQLAVVQRSGRVRRYHKEDTLHTQTVGEHTYGVMWLVRLLSDNQPSAALLLAALAHDTAEVHVGDVPSPTKRQVKAQFDAMEDEFMASVGMAPPAITPAEARTLKLADLLEGLQFCLSEQRRGNADIRPVTQNYWGYIRAMAPTGTAATVFNILTEQLHELEGE